MLQELLKAFILIFMAEMGDKTQILAMAFATKYKVKKVLLGIFLGVLLNHGLAVLFGSYISNIIPMNTVQMVAGIVFVAFALWTLKSDDEVDEESKQVQSKFGPVLTVAFAFFAGELGDKTQLTAITLAADARYPLLILCGTVLGMVATGGLGIFVGKKLGDKIPEFTVKIIASVIFMCFGVSKLYRTVSSQYITLPNIFLFASAVSVMVFMILRPIIRRRREGKESLLKAKSRDLYNYYKQAEKNINHVCLGTDTCGECQGTYCIVGTIKQLIKNGLDQNDLFESDDLEGMITKQYNKEVAEEFLALTLKVLKEAPEQNKYKNVHRIRKKLELILFEQCIEDMNNWQEYQEVLRNIGAEKANRILKQMG